MVLQNHIYKGILSHYSGQNQKSLIPCSEQLPDAVVSESVPASREEELGAWPDSPKLWSPSALLLLPARRKHTIEYLSETFALFP